MTVLLIGATYAYFEIAITNSFGTHNINANLPKAGLVTLQSQDANLYLSPTLPQMMEDNQGIYFGVKEPNIPPIKEPTSDEDIAETTAVLAHASVNEEGTYNCTYDIDITVANNTLKEALVTNTGIVILIVNETEYDLANMTFTDNKYTINGSFNYLANESPKQITARIRLKNANENQNTLAGTGIDLSFAISNLSCKAVNEPILTNMKGLPIGEVLINAKDTRGLNKTKEDGMYRYQGTNADVDNYICFGTSNKDICTGTPGTYMYRIIGIEDAIVDVDGSLESLESLEELQPRVKLIKKESIGTHQWSEYEISRDDIPWPYSDLKRDLNEAFFLNNTTYVPAGWEYLIENVYWRNNNVGANGYDVVSIGDTAHDIYVIEEQSSTSYIEAKIGLMKLHDYNYARNVGGNNCSSSEEQAKCKESWMHISNNQVNTEEWTMSYYGSLLCTQTTVYLYSWNVSSNGQACYNYEDNLYAVRPVFYLTSSTVYKSGTGTINNPIIIGMRN